VVGSHRLRLWHALSLVPDNRRAEAKRYPLASLLLIAVAAFLSGRRDQLGIVRWGRRLTREALASIGISRARVPAPSVWCELFNQNERLVSATPPFAGHSRWTAHGRRRARTLDRDPTDQQGKDEIAAAITVRGEDTVKPDPMSGAECIRLWLRFVHRAYFCSGGSGRLATDGVVAPTSPSLSRAQGGRPYDCRIQYARLGVNTKPRV